MNCCPDTGGEREPYLYCVRQIIRAIQTRPAVGGQKLQETSQSCFACCFDAADIREPSVSALLSSYEDSFQPDLREVQADSLRISSHLV